MFLARFLNINSEDLFFAEEICWNDLINAEKKLKVTLVDHNCLAR